MTCFLEGPKIGVSRSYRLNPNYGWKGSGKNHKQALKEYQSVIRVSDDVWKKALKGIQVQLISSMGNQTMKNRPLEVYSLSLRNVSSPGGCTQCF